MTRTVKKLKAATPPKEDQEQILLATWLDKQGIKYYAIPNGGYSLNLFQALKLKRMGLKSGAPDLCIPLAIKPYHGLYIELKRVKGGKVSELQQDWLNYLNEAGYLAEVAYGFEHAKEIVLRYLNTMPKAA